jgi:hypothetical protein
MKRAIVVLTLLTLVASAYAGTLVFNFDDARQLSGNWFKAGLNDPEKVDWSVENGELVAIVREFCGGLSGVFLCDNDSQDWRNYEMSLKFKLAETLVPACRIYSNVVFGTNVYGPEGFVIQANYLSLETRGAGGPWDRVSLGTQDYVWKGGPPLKSPLEEGRWYTLRMVSENGFNKMFIDDELIAQTWSANPSPDFARGHISFGIKNAEMHFDDLTLKGDDIPDNKDLKPVSGGVYQLIIEKRGFQPLIPESELPPEKLAAVSPRAKLAATWGQVKAH